MALKAIMYHYVRPDDARFPHFKHLHVEDFRRQLDYLAANGGFADKETFIAALRGEAQPPTGHVLTFDDGFMDHVSHVLPELEKRGLWGIFYVSTAPLTDGTLLDVHRIHLLLGRHGAAAVAEALRRIVSDEMLDESHRAEFRQSTYLWQRNPNDALYVKRMLNYFIAYEHRSAVLDTLMARFFGEEEAELGAGFYMQPNHLRELLEAGMIVGSHSHSHRVMSRLPLAEQKREIDDSFRLLEERLGLLRPRTFCYPYGGRHTYTEDTERLLDEGGVLFSFVMEPRDITVDDLRARRQALPRYDCNMFPHGQCRN